MQIRPVFSLSQLTDYHGKNGKLSVKELHVHSKQVSVFNLVKKKKRRASFSLRYY
jgi:hypothetical protein